MRLRTGKKVAVLAGTEQKLDEMLKSELATDRNNPLSEEAIQSITGFDRFMGPDDLIAHYRKYNGEDSEYVFYGRTSRPKSWLRNPAYDVDEEFMGQPEILKFVRAHAITHNFDDAKLPFGHPAIIMDTKEALVMTGSAYLVTQPSDIYSPEFQEYLADNAIDMSEISAGSLTQRKKNKLGGLFLNFPPTNLLSESLITHLESRGLDPTLIASGEKKVRAKPLKQHYGIYGHEVGSINRAKFISLLMEQIRLRGDYIIQPEFANLQIIDSTNPQDSYVAIDRVFFVRGADGELHPVESCRSLMPAQSQEGKKNNVHEGSHTRCARIVI